ncbi:hypothetical protein QJS10_CPB22g00202 [Acorus calamus]|uniref:Uncharacterized protein n=1 Tax=Acorus calamus TaxID=4465 RepID=A0AAV9C0J6_ACOCL|nr:hypothetical protein QJS10_CPB22g00202 [Acorus calamus]
MERRDVGPDQPGLAGPYWIRAGRVGVYLLLGLAVLLRDKAATREIINMSEELYKASNNGIIRMVTGMREGSGGVDEAREFVKGVAETIQTDNLFGF